MIQFVNFVGYGPGYDGSNRESRSGHLAGRKTLYIEFIEEICPTPDEPTCNPEYLFRTILGECNNLG